MKRAASGGGPRTSDRSTRVCVQTIVSSTSMFPRVAFEYGHTWCAALTSASAVGRSMPGSEIAIATWMPKPVGIGPMPTSAVIETSEGSGNFCLAATAFSAPMKHAE